MTEQPTNTPTNDVVEVKKIKIRSDVRELWNSIVEWFGELMNLTDGMDREGTIIAIKSGKKMRGANAWLLICSIMIASLGLDLNSPAVIIGAMLISPLMAPILGIGLAVGINDREALFLSLRHFGIAIAIALFTSTLYFVVTPLGDLTNEIRARTAPTLLDGLVAIFGGLAGIISTSRKEKGSAIPGVAIATALMPPLCVTGYGIANGNLGILLNSFYLFFLNSFFIATTTFLIIRLLKFPLRKYMDDKEAARTRWIIFVVSLIMILPSTLILYDLWGERQRDLQVQEFVDNYFNGNSSTRCIDYNFIEGDSTNTLFLQLIGEDIPPDTLTKFQNGLAIYPRLANTELTVLQELDADLELVENMQLELQNLNKVTNQLQNINKEKNKQELQIDTLRTQLDSLKGRLLAFEQLKSEAHAIFTDMDQIGYGNIQQSDFDGPTKQLPVFVVQWKKGKQRWSIAQDEKKLYDFLTVRTGLDTLAIIHY